MAAASSDFAPLATVFIILPLNISSPGFGFSSLLSFKICMAESGKIKLNLRKTARASSKVEGSGAVGPDPITETSSPITSEINKVTSPAGTQALASLPPFTRDKCLRTMFISLIVAPERMSNSLIRFFSSSVIPSLGKVNSAELPPEIKQRTRSSALRPLTFSSIFDAAFCPAISGRG